ncbi:hypothetical protein DSM3645_06444 [Blastopirellula marina DSM 3645]|uniref:Uncharacterized protein n=1 Tax=Blastopirellula marina DSM 3645 TaxID=314230 RepID=A4A2T0_9BACT|nr:hypothetical protein DSM3645_06444 [Blastopirellula marina DSM 3645]
MTSSLVDVDAGFFSLREIAAKGMAVTRQLRSPAS